jgi:UDPglucose--hexose-1-phosphate uridylyltransferase
VTSPPEFRFNVVTGQWVVIAPARSDRPRQLREKADDDAATRSPFVPGREDQIPPIILELRDPEGPDWQVRVVENKYPVLLSEPLAASASASRLEGIDSREVHQPGIGRHEVVVESPEPLAELTDLSPARLATVVEAYCLRHASMRTEGLVPFVFRNRGRAAGATLRHPHAQIIGLPLVPPDVAHRHVRARQHLDEHGTTLVAALLAAEERAGSRMIAAEGGFAAFVPFAAAVPGEVWVVPRQPHADFGSLDERARHRFSTVLLHVLRRLRDALDDPDYNFYIEPPPLAEQLPWMHWFLRILPVNGRQGGFEPASGVRINPSLPEDDAGRLRGG